MALCKLHAVWFHASRAFTPGIPVYFGPKMAVVVEMGVRVGRGMVMEGLMDCDFC